MLQEEFEARAPEIIKKTAEFADLLEACDCYQWGDEIYVDDHGEMVYIMLRLISSASCIARNLEAWRNKGQSDQTADRNADSPRPVAKVKPETQKKTA
ncbi:MAG: hypothetical protein CVV53_01005 [Spirochaetae bacterium HGW-Spirochaetae-9]|nr:MAG: hypothetical protein CVV53_01005 [Spirochaetae bacterium HGW-Spirochaetae-9]